jgi:hypothetical protein
LALQTMRPGNSGRRIGSSLRGFAIREWRSEPCNAMNRAAVDRRVVA